MTNMQNVMAWFPQLSTSHSSLQCSNIPAEPAYDVYILQLVRNSMAYVQYSDFLDSAQVLKKKLPKQGEDMVLNATFNNISVLLWPSVLLVEETGVPGENHRPGASHWQTLSHNVVSRSPRLSGDRTHNVSGDRH